MSIRVSIIVPIYNVERYIKDCFLSIAKQSYDGPMECLFIDDCGTDKSVGILKGLIIDYNGPIEMRVLHHERNRGLSAARNTGIIQSKGDYVFFLDSDDKLYPNTIERLSQAAIKENYPDIILGGYQVNVQNHPINQYKYEYQVIDGHPLIVSEYLNYHLFCMAHNKLISRRFILDNNLCFKEGIIHEDNLWSFQSFHLAKRVVTIPNITYFYFVHEGSIMTALSHQRSLESAGIIYEEVLKDIDGGRYEPVGQDSVDYIQKIINDKCLNFFFDFYERNNYGQARLHVLRTIPDYTRRVISEYWIAPTPFLKVLRFLFKYGYYRVFDCCMMLSLIKNTRNN